MGLISYFKNLYYDNRLKKADRFLDEGKTSEAEDLYMSIIDKHPQAACRLADYYFNLSSKADVKTDVTLFKKTVELKSLGSGVYDTETYSPVLSEFVEHIKKRANNCFNSGQYSDCYSLTSALKSTGCHSSEDITLNSEAKIKLLYVDINSTKVTDKKFQSLVESFKKEWAFCKKSKRAIDSSLQFCQSLTDSNRNYASNIILSIILDNAFESRCLNNAIGIISGNDVEANDGIVKSVASSYANPLVFRKGNSTEESVSLFKKCWKAAKDNAVVLDILRSSKDTTLRNALVDEIINNHSDYLSSANLHEEFSKWISENYEGEQGLNLLEKLNGFGYAVEELYTKKVHEWIAKLPFEERLSHLDHAQNLFPNSAIIIDDKLLCAQQYLDQKENEKAKEVSESILDKCEKARLVKAQALCNISSNEPDLDKRIELLKQAKATISSCSGSEKKTIKNGIVAASILVAKSYYRKGDIDKSYTVLTSLAKEGSEKAVFAIAELRLSEVKSENSVTERLTKTIDAIGELRRFGISTIVENQDYQQLWCEKITLFFLKNRNLDNIAAVAQLESLIHEIDAAGFKATIIKERKADLLKELIKRKYLIARDLEQANSLPEALDLYKEINTLEAKRTPTLSAIRFILCKLKMQNNSDILEHRERIYNILKKSAEAYKLEKEDIAYRFALVLLKSGEDQEALDVLSKFLPGEEHLKKACEQGAIIKALAKLEDFNKKLESVKDKSLSSDDAVYFINHMLEYAEIIKPVLDLPRSTLSKYRNKLKNYAIFKLFDEERYDIAFEKMLKEHKDFLDDYTALRNIALVCLNMAEANQITQQNYEDVISIWLTAIYQEKLFVKSLDYTSWDDQFTFSLYEAYGHFNDDSLGWLPENVNNDYSDDSDVVSIKEVQRALLDRFEAAISNNQQYHEFYTVQKDEMDAFIDLNLDIKCRLVAPFLAHKDEEVFEEIYNALERDRSQGYDNWEDVLSVGVSYQMPLPIYSDYSKAKSYYEDCISVIDTINVNRVKQAFLSTKVEMIKRFGKLYSALNSYTNSKVSSLSANNKTEFQKNYNFYLVICSALKDSTISFVFSNFIMQYVVGKVNDNSMRKSEAADYILSIYSLDKNNSRVKDNLTTLFEMLARDSSTDSSRAVTTILGKVRTLDATFYNALNNEYEQAKVDKELNEIVTKLTSKSMSESSALQKVYSLYTNNTNNDDVCEVLAQLCTACIMKYIIHQEYGGSSVTSVLNGLKNNMSSTFRRHNHHLRDAYNNIWNQLPYNTKALLQGSSLSAIAGETLNDKGLALKRGLDYFKSLGGVSSSSSINDLLGLF